MNVLVFGANGDIGRDITHYLASKNYNIVRALRKTDSNPNNLPFNDITVDILDNNFSEMLGHKYDAIVFAQGINFNDSVLEFDDKKHIEMYAVNCLFILKAMNFLVTNELLTNNSNVVILSSIWQNIARQNKLSYMVTKSAIAGIVMSLSIDLASRGCSVNAILPGAIETKMTLANLSTQQIESLKKQTPSGSLATTNDIAKAVEFLISSTGITGQMINIDYGFSYAKFF